LAARRLAVRLLDAIGEVGTYALQSIPCKVALSFVLVNGAAEIVRVLQGEPFPVPVQIAMWAYDVVLLLTGCSAAVRGEPHKQERPRR
jgi:hypothetical protein